MKCCTSCKEIKNKQDFSKYYLRKDGLYSICKKCKLSYRRSKTGLIAQIYGSQQSRSKRKGREYPTYTGMELREWLFSQKKFHLLYDNWKRLDYQKDYVPSVDRIDDNVWYTMSNIQLMTWRENNDKGYMDRKSRKTKHRGKGVKQFTKNGEFIAEYYSIKEANRQTKINMSSIHKVCAKNRNHAGGFLWELSK